MIIAATVMMLLPHQGYWLGSQKEDVQVEWAVPDTTAAADVSWTLMAGNVRLSHGTATLDKNEKPAHLEVTTPNVRTRVSASLVYRVQDHGSGKDLGNGEMPIRLFPDTLIHDMADRLKGKRLALCDSAEDLYRLLKENKVEVVRAREGASLIASRYDVIWVSGDALGASPFAQQPLLDQAHAGASVLVFGRTSSDTRLFGYALAQRKTPSHIDWRTDHPLLSGFDPDELASWLRDVSDLWAIELPADEPALELASWPREVPGTRPVPLDALLVSKTVGAGRIVICQLPLGDWRTDPRSQMLLVNAMDYALTRPEPTLRPSERTTTQPAAPASNQNRIALPGE